MSRLLALLGLADGFSWLGVLKLVLTVADKLADIVRARQLISAGEDRQIAKQLANIAHSAGVSKQVNEEIDAMSEGQVQDAVEADAR